MASMIEAWLSWSLTTRSWSVRSVAGTASLAFQALTKLRDDAVPTNRAHAASRVRWMVKVPQEDPTQSRPRPEAVQRFPSCSQSYRLIRQAEIVVGGQDDDFPPTLHLHPGALGTLQEVEPLVGAFTDELLELGLDPLLQRVRHSLTSRITLPAWPSLMT